MFFIFQNRCKLFSNQTETSVKDVPFVKISSTTFFSIKQNFKAMVT